MTLAQQVYAQATLMSEQEDARQQELLRLLCQSVTSALTARLREGLTPADCKADVIAAASLYALSAMATIGQAGDVEKFQAGDMTVSCRSNDAASKCLFNQAELIISPYLKQSFSFRGV